MPNQGIKQSETHCGGSLHPRFEPCAGRVWRTPHVGHAVLDSVCIAHLLGLARGPNSRPEEGRPSDKGVEELGAGRG